MKVGVVIERKNYYRLLGPVVDEGLARRWQMVCLHDYGQPRSGMKGYEFPSVKSVPRFRHGSPHVKVYHGRHRLLDTIRAESLDAVISVMPPPDGLQADGLHRTRWVSLQYAGELLYHLIPSGARGVDVLALYSSWWLGFGLKVLRGRGLTAPDDGLEREICQKSAVVGFPEVDQFGAIDPVEVRCRWGIPPGKPVVAFLPYPFRSNPRTPWSRWVHSPGSRAWRRMRLRLSGARHLESVLAKGWDDVAVTRAVRRFCDANGAYLLVKARAKDPVPRYLARVADLALDDRSHYPPTILEVLAAADLCVHFYSGAVLEAVACGVPSLSMCPELDEMGAASDWQSLLFSREEGSMYQFRGVAETMSIGEAIERLPERRLSEFGSEPFAKKAYTEKFLGFDDGRSSSRLLDAVQRVVEGERS